MGSNPTVFQPAAAPRRQVLECSQQHVGNVLWDGITHRPARKKTSAKTVKGQLKGLVCKKGKLLQNSSAQTKLGTHSYKGENTTFNLHYFKIIIQKAPLNHELS